MADSNKPGATKAFHQGIKNMFGGYNGGAQTSTTSVTATFENMSTTTSQLLVETVRSNRAMLNVLTQHTKLLKMIANRIGWAGLDLGDLLGARVLGKLFGVAGKAFGGAAMGVVRAAGKVGLVVGAGLLGITKNLFKGVGGVVLGTFGKAGTAILNAVKGAGAVVTKYSSGIARVFTNPAWTGLLRSVGQIGAVAAKLLGKLAIPIAVIMGIWDSVSGWTNAEDILGKQDVNLKDRIVSAVGSVINGLLLGLPDWLSKTVGGRENYAQSLNATVDMAINLGNGIIKTSQDLLNMSMESAQGALQWVMDAIPTPEELWRALTVDVPEMVQDTFKTAWDAITSGMWNLGKALSTAIGDWFNNIGSGIGKFLFGGSDDPTNPSNSIGGQGKPNPAPVAPNNAQRNRYNRRKQGSMYVPSATRTVTPAYGEGMLQSVAYTEDFASNSKAYLLSAESNAKSVQNDLYSATNPDFRGWLDASLKIASITGAKLVEVLSKGMGGYMSPTGGAGGGFMQASVRKYTGPGGTGGEGGNNPFMDLYNASGSRLLSLLSPYSGMSGSGDVYPGGGSSLPPGVTGPSAPGAGGSYNPNVSPNGQPLSVAKMDHPIKQMLYNKMKAAGYSDVAISAALAHAENESAFNPNARGDGGDAVGLFQWNSRRPELQRYAANKGADWRDPNVQTDFFLHELNTSESKWGDRLRSAKTPSQANSAMSGFERYKGWNNPYGRENGQRLSDTTKYLGALQGAERMNLPGQTPGGTASLGNPANVDPNDQMGVRGNGSWEGVDPRLRAIYEATAAEFPLRSRIMSGRQGRGSGDHSRGNAFDMTLYDQNGNALPNYQDGQYFRTYQMFAQMAELKGREMHPELFDGKGEEFNWGGLFGDAGPRRYKYGSNDLMDFRIANDARFRAGTIMGGLNKQHSWYAQNDTLGGSKPYDPDTFAADLEKLKGLRLTPQQLAERRMFGVARRSGSLSPRDDVRYSGSRFAGDLSNKDMRDRAAMLFNEGNSPLSTDSPRATPYPPSTQFSSPYSEGYMPKGGRITPPGGGDTGLPGANPPTKPTPTSDAPIYQASLSSKVGDIPTTDEWKMLITNGSALTG